MNQAYRIVFECPCSHHNINFQRKLSKSSLSDEEALEMFGHEEISCTSEKCGWRGRASSARILRILPFIWVFQPAA
jgi:hypothetical protein